MPEKEYIEREAVMADIKNLSVFLGGDNVFNKTAKESVLDIINFQPTADVAEVVRCGECMHRGDGDVCPMRHFVWTPDEGYKIVDLTMDDYFCSEGERREK